MKFNRFLAAAVGLVIILRPAAAAELSAVSIDRIEYVVTELMHKSGAPGISVAVATGNQLQYERGFGLADLENDVAVIAETRFRTASIAKSMTAVVVLALAERGDIDLDADVSGYVPEFSTKRWPVTSRQLLGHLGGIRHYKNTAEAKSTQQFFSLKSALPTFADDPLLHEPGTKYRYSTFGYNLLGSVAEAVGKQQFMGLLQTLVFDPAGMTKSAVDDQSAIVPGRTRGYLKATESMLMLLGNDHNLKAGQIYNAPLHDTSMKIPGGGLLSTSSDLVRFATALNTGKLLKNETCKQIWTRQATADGKETEYGLGWGITQRSGQKMISHPGDQAGTATVLVLFPDTGTSIAIMCNLQGVSLQATAVAIADVVAPVINTVDYSQAVDKLKNAARHEVEAKHLPAFSISLVDDDRVVWADGFGFQDAEKKVPATAESVYRVGSVSKLFTNIAVMQLVETGKLNLDAPIQDYMPNLQPENSSGIPLTLRQMMSHRSGLVRESPVGNYFDPTEPTLAATVESLNSTALVYKPETKTKYSNAAVAVVGAALEAQLEMSHPERVRQNILDPLKMDSSSLW